jgi:hypothetical protein
MPPNWFFHRCHVDLLELSTDLGGILAFVEQYVTVGELSDHLLGCVMPLLHDVLLAPFRCVGTVSRAGSFS